MSLKICVPDCTLFSVDYSPPFPHWVAMILARSGSLWKVKMQKRLDGFIFLFCHLNVLLVQPKLFKCILNVVPKWVPMVKCSCCGIVWNKCSTSGRNWCARQRSPGLFWRGEEFVGDRWHPPLPSHPSIHLSSPLQSIHSGKFLLQCWRKGFTFAIDFKFQFYL